MTPEDVREAPIPFDRLTELANEMQEHAQTEEYDDVKGIIFLHDSDRGGICMFGYTDVTAAFADLLVHMKAMMQSQGKSFGVMTDQGFWLMDPD